MKPAVIVPDDPDGKTIIADAGSIIQLADQTVMYRDRVSPITRRADERLVRYGKADKPVLGWMRGPLFIKQSKGPTFLVTTSNEESVSAWDRFRFKIGRARTKDASEWLVPWLVRNGAKYPAELRAVVREFGGKPIKNEGFDARCAKAFQLILSTEIDMASAKAAKKAAKKGGKKAAKSATPARAAKSEKGKATKTKVKADSGRVTRAHDDHIIKRLVKENPRRAGSEKAKVWDKLRKGMTVGEFLAKGGKRGAVALYVRSGWVKLLKPKGDSDE